MNFRQGTHNWTFLIKSSLCSLALVATLSQGASGAELTGFGPIPFGMSKEDALVVLGDKIKAHGENFINYELPLKFGPQKLKVEQRFSNGMAKWANVSLEPRGDSPELCLSQHLRYSGVIQAKYGVAPRVRHGRPRRLIPGSGVIFVEDEHLYQFENGASVQSNVHYWFLIKSCSIFFRYVSPPQESPPF